MSTVKTGGFVSAQKDVVFPKTATSLRVTADDISGAEFVCWVMGIAMYNSGNTYATYMNVTFTDTSSKETTITLPVWQGADRNVYLIALYRKT